MKKGFKNYRIMSEKGDALLLSRKRFRSLIETLDRIAGDDQNNGRQKGDRK